MKEGWEVKKLGDVSKVQRGLTYSRKDTVDLSENIVLRATNISLENQKLDFSELKYLNNNFKIDDKYKLKKGSILICFSSGSKSHLGKVALVDSDYNFSFGGFIGQINPSNEIDSQYLFYNLISDNYRSYILGLTDGVNINNLKSNDLKNFQIPIPPLPEQKQIVALLDKAFAAIDQAQANIEKNIENAKELFQSKLNDIFSQKGDGWEERKLNEICEVKDGTHDSPKYVDENDGIPFVTQKNILDEGLSFESTKFISVSDHESFYKRSNVAFEDILFAMIGANRGMACIVDDKRTFSIKNVGLIKSNESYRPKYLLYYLKSPLAKKYVDENSSGSAQGFIGLGKLRAFPIPYTDIEMQVKIEGQIESLNEFIISTISFYNQKLTNLEDLKKSILQKAFSGELTQKSIVTSI